MRDPTEKLKKIMVRTSQSGWLKEVAEAYRARTPIQLEDDAMIGVDPREDSLLEMGKKGRLSMREWTGVLIALGIAGMGAWLLVMAVLDPEPYTKVAAAIATGAVLLSTGGLVAVRILTNAKPPNVRVTKAGTFEIYWS